MCSTHVFKLNNSMITTAMNHLNGRRLHPITSSKSYWNLLTHCKSANDDYVCVNTYVLVCVCKHVQIKFYIYFFKFTNSMLTPNSKKEEKSSKKEIHPLWLQILCENPHTHNHPSTLNRLYIDLYIDLSKLNLIKIGLERCWTKPKFILHPQLIVYPV